MQSFPAQRIPISQLVIARGRSVNYSSTVPLYHAHTSLAGKEGVRQSFAFVVCRLMPYRVASSSESSNTRGGIDGQRATRSHWEALSHEILTGIRVTSGAYPIQKRHCVRLKSRSMNTYRACVPACCKMWRCSGVGLHGRVGPVPRCLTIYFGRRNLSGRTG